MDFRLESSGKSAISDGALNLVKHFNLTVERDIEISPRNGIIGGERNSWNSSFRIERSRWPLFLSLPVAIPPHF